MAELISIQSNIPWNKHSIPTVSPWSPEGLGWYVAYLDQGGDPRHPKTPSRPQGDRNLRGVPSQPWPQRQAGGGCRPSFVTSGGRSTNGCRTRDPWNFGVFTVPPDLGFGMEHCKISLIRRQSKIFSTKKNNSWVILQGPGQKNSQELAQKNWTWWVYDICRICNRIPEIDTEFQILAIRTVMLSTGEGTAGSAASRTLVKSKLPGREWDLSMVI